jgi:hypothetical protein
MAAVYTSAENMGAANYANAAKGEKSHSLPNPIILPGFTIR